MADRSPFFAAARSSLRSTTSTATPPVQLQFSCGSICIFSVCFLGIFQPLCGGLQILRGGGLQPEFLPIGDPQTARIEQAVIEPAFPIGGEDLLFVNNGDVSDIVG